MKLTIDEIRTALVRRSGGAGRPYPTHLRTAVLAHAEQRKLAGLSPGAIATELGVSAATLRKWQHDAVVAPSAFYEVELVTPSAPASGLVVHGPAGLRIEGATIAHIVELVRRLA
ncbi:MAG: hypothetical protein U0359_24185 [Byssovorax sp.]